MELFENVTIMTLIFNYIRIRKILALQRICRLWYTRVIPMAMSIERPRRVIPKERGLLLYGAGLLVWKWSALSSHLLVSINAHAMIDMLNRTRGLQPNAVLQRRADQYRQDWVQE